MHHVDLVDEVMLPQRLERELDIAWIVFGEQDAAELAGACHWSSLAGSVK
jgi:hypothetical protein